VTVYRQKGRPTITVWPREGGEKLDLGDLCIAFSCSKGIYEPAGSFRLALAPRQGTQGPVWAKRFADAYKRVRIGSVISFGFDRPGGIMLGIVKSVQRAHHRGGPNPSFSINISGADFGMILSQDNIVHASLSVQSTPDFLDKIEAVTGPNNVLLQALPGLWGPESPGPDKLPGVFVGNDVETIISFIFENAISMTTPQLGNMAGGSEKPGEFIDTISSITIWNNSRVWSEGLNDYQGSLWAFVKSLLDEDFYEVFVTTIPQEGTDLPRVTLVIRPKPFDEEALDFIDVPLGSGGGASNVPEDVLPGISWTEVSTLTEGLEYHELAEDEVFSEEAGISDNDAFSYYECTSQFSLIGNDQSRQEGLYYPLVDTFMLQRHGLRKMQGRLSLLSSNVADKSFGDQPIDSELQSEVAKFRSRLFNWHRLNTYFETGTFVVRGRDHFRAGDRVFAPWIIPQVGDEVGLTYYCVQTTHQWSFGQNYTTQLQLTRGHNNGMISAAKDEIAADAPASNPDHYAAT